MLGIRIAIREKRLKNFVKQFNEGISAGDLEMK